MFKNLLLNAVSSVIYFFLQWLTTVLAVRLADFETAGIYALAISFTNLFYFVALFGIRNYQISDITNRFSSEQYFAARIITAIAAIVMFGAAIFTTKQSKYAVSCYVVYMAFKIEEAFTDGYFPLLQIKKNYARLALSYTAKGIFSTAAFSVALYVTHNLLTAILWATIGYGICIVTLDMPDLLQMHLEGPQFIGCLEILSKCAPLMLVSLSTPIMNYVVRNAISVVLNDYMLGQYASLSSVIVVMGTFAGVIFIVFIPEISQWKQKNDWYHIKKLCGYAVLGMAILGVFVLIAGKILGNLICTFIFGSSISENIDLLLPLIFTAILLMLKTFFSAILVPLNQRWCLLFGEVSGICLCAVLVVPLTSHFGLQGANISYMIGTAAQLITLSTSVFSLIHKKRNSKKLI